MPRVSDDEVLLLWRALRSFRSGARPACKPSGRARRGGPPASLCPLVARCPRWQAATDDREAMLEETIEQTEARRAAWPCSRLLDLLSPGVTQLR